MVPHAKVARQSLPSYRIADSARSVVWEQLWQAVSVADCLEQEMRSDVRIQRMAGSYPSSIVINRENRCSSRSLLGLYIKVEKANASNRGGNLKPDIVVFYSQQHIYIYDTVQVICGTRFGHPDRYEDAVSREICCAMRRPIAKSWRIAIAIGVRYSQSPCGLAAALAKTSTAAAVMTQLSCFKRSKVYRQAIPTANLRSLFLVSSAICRHATFRCFDDLADYT